MKLFKPNFKLSSRLIFPQRPNLNREVNIFDRDIKYTYHSSGPVVKDILKRIPSSFYVNAESKGYFPIFNIRVNRPSENIRWTSDYVIEDFTGNSIKNSDFTEKEPDIYNLMCSITTNGNSGFQILNNEFYGDIDKIHQYDNINVYDVKNGNIIKYDSRTIYRETPVVEGLFFKMILNKY